MNSTKRTGRRWRSANTAIALALLALLALPSLTMAQETQAVSPTGGGGSDFDPDIWHQPPGPTDECTDVVIFADVRTKNLTTLEWVKVEWWIRHPGGSESSHFNGFMTDTGTNANHGGKSYDRFSLTVPESAFDYQDEIRYRIIAKATGNITGHDYYEFEPGSTSHKVVDVNKRCTGSLKVIMEVYGWQGGPLPSAMHWFIPSSPFAGDTTTGNTWNYDVYTGERTMKIEAAPVNWTRNVNISGPGVVPPNGGSYDSFNVTIEKDKLTTVTITYTQDTGKVKLYMDRDAADIYTAADPQVAAKWYITSGPSGAMGPFSHGQEVVVPAGGGYAFSWDSVPQWDQQWTSISGKTVPKDGTFEWSEVYTRHKGKFIGRMVRNAADIYTADDPKVVGRWSIDERPDLGTFTDGQSQMLPTGFYTFRWTSVSGWDQQWVNINKEIKKDETLDWSEVYTRHFGTAQLFINPAGEPRDNARWYISENPGLGYFSSGQTTPPLPTGDYTFVFTTLECYDQSIGSTVGTITKNGNFQATETYTRQAFTLQINMTYDIPLQGGDTPGTASLYQGASLLEAGITSGSLRELDKGVSYTVVYGTIPFYNTPANVEVFVACDNIDVQSVSKSSVSPAIELVADFYASREYTRKSGPLTVILQEDGVAPGPGGAEYTVSGFGGGFPTTGTSTAPINIYQGMPYSVAFNTIANYDTPSTPVGVNLPDGPDGVPSQTVFGNYIPHTGTLVGFANVPDGTGYPTGALWRVPGLFGWQGIGDSVPGLPLGTYTVQFEFVDGYVTPFTRQVTISSKGQVANTVGIYIPNEQLGSLQVFIEPKNEVIPEGALWRPVLNFEGVAPVAYPWKESGDIVNDLPVGSVGIEFYVAPGWILPELTGSTIKENQLTKATGEYIRPLIVHAADYNGDGLDDLGAFDSSSGKWTVVSTVALSPSAKTVELVDAKFGKKDDIAAPGDYDGDGIADLAFYREKTGEYRIKQTTGSLRIKNFGEDRDIPVPGDYDGDGKTDAALYRPTTGEWIFYRIFEDLAANDDVTTFTFGWNGAVPVPGDYNADGMTDLAVYDVKARTWHLAIWKQKKGTWVNVKSMQTPYGKLQFPVQHGEIGNIPIQADYDGDGSSDIAIFRRGDVNFNVLNQYEIQVGKPGDMPVPNDWAGLGRVIPAVFRANAGRWIAVDNLLGTTLLNAKHGTNSTPLMSGR